MSEKSAGKKKNILIPGCIIFSILYIIFAIAPLSTELNFIPVWTVSAFRATPSSEDIPKHQDASTSSTAASAKLPFILGQNLGYFDENAVIHTSKTFPFKATIIDSAYCVYSSGDAKEKMTIFDENDSEIGKIESSGFPYFTRHGKFLFLPGGASFSKIDDEGKTLWTFEGYAPITAFSTSRGGISVGTSDGTLIVFESETGKIRQSFIPGGSEIPAIFGCDISDDGKYFACLTGLNRQRFVIAEEKNGHIEIIFHKFLENQIKRQTIVKFNEESNVVYYDAETLGIVSLKTLKDSSLPIKGVVTSIKESPVNDFIFVLSHEHSASGEKRYTVSVLEPFDSVAGKFSFNASNSFIEVKDNMLFVGRDTEISRMDIEKK